MERRKTTIFMAKKILICLVLLHCCIAAVSAAPTLISYGDYVNGTIVHQPCGTRTRSAGHPGTQRMPG